ncbi:hypothetical protein CJ030_MR4G023046 [Morella rubra]|uniref:Uncharacterized protein n=1 Tax=Morella rubra TaxID=262757 RepID=A0A6A1VUD5_9ROSI|nr:hypothetical protein CJ030_MR4G023046 [Morella rubra]
MNTAYRTHRNRMFQHYSVFNSKEEALEHPYPDMNKEEWTRVCDLFASEEFQRRSAINKENRAKLKIVHTSGARALYGADDARASADDGGAATEERRRADADDGRAATKKRQEHQKMMEEQQRTLVEQQERRMQLMAEQMREQLMEQIRQLQSRSTPKRKFG